MKFLSQIVTAASGSIGGTTYSRNRGGMYQRARATPVNPNTAFQVQVRAGMTAAVNAWIALLQSERDQWDLYAANTPVTDALGQEIFLTGQQCFIRTFTPISQSNQKLLLTQALPTKGPSIFNRGDYTTPVVTATAAFAISVDFNASDDWVNEDEAAMFVYQGRPMNPSRKFFNGPWRLIETIAGDSTTPPTSPASIATADVDARGYHMVAGQAMSVATAVVRTDGRISSRRISGPFIIG